MTTHTEFMLETQDLPPLPAVPHEGTDRNRKSIRLCLDPRGAQVAIPDRDKGTQYLMPQAFFPFWVLPNSEYLEELLRLGIVPKAWEEARFCPASDSSSSERLAVPDAIRDESSSP